MRLFTRGGHDLPRIPLVVAAAAALAVRSCLIDGKAIVTNEAGLAAFELIRSWRYDHAAVFCAFDLLELDGEDLRLLPIERRKKQLARLLPKPFQGMAFNQYFAGDGDIVYRQACKLGCEGHRVEAVSVRPTAPVDRSIGSRSRTRRRPPVRREAEEEWGR